MDTSCVVWAKMRLCSFWPAIMIKNPPEEIRERGQPGQICVQFFSTRKYGYVNADMVKEYSGNRERYSSKKTRGLAKAVAECDRFLAVTENFGNDLNTGSTDDSIALQLELPFEIKQEPEEEQSHMEEKVKINQNQLNESPQHDKTEFRRNSENTNEQKISTISNEVRKQIGMEIDSKMILLTERYDKEIRDLRNDLKELIDKEKERDIQERLKAEYETNISDLNKKLEEMSKRHDNMVAAKQKSEDEIKNRLKAEYETKISDLNKKLEEMSKRHDDMVAAKQKSEDKIQKRLQAEYTTKVSDVNEKLRGLSKRYDQMTVANQKSQEDSYKRKAKHQPQISDLDEKLHAVNKRYVSETEKHKREDAMPPKKSKKSKY